MYIFAVFFSEIFFMYQFDGEIKRTCLLTYENKNIKIDYTQNIRGWKAFQNS